MNKPNRNPEPTEKFLETISQDLLFSISLFSGQCNFKISSNQTNPDINTNTNTNPDNPNQTLEQTRKNLIQQTLKSTSIIFNESLQSEQVSLDYIKSLIISTRDQRPTTRSRSSSTKPSPSSIPNLSSTPLNSLYLGTEDDQVEINDQTIWNQIKLKQTCVMGWMREVLDEDEAEELDEDIMAENRKEALGLPTEEEEDDDDEGLFDFDEMDSDDFEGMNESSTEKSEEEEEEEKKSIPYITTLNDQESSEGSESSTLNPTLSHQTKQTSSSISSDPNLSLNTLESRNKSIPKPHSNKPKRSKVDDHFFSLSEFEEETDQGEIEMRQKLRKWSKENHQPEEEEEDDDDEDDEDVDLFSGFDTGILHGEDEDEDDDDEDGNAMDLDMVANLRYGDFFDPPAGLPTKKSNPKNPNPTEKKPTKNTLKKKRSDPEKTEQPSKSPRVMFSEKVIVKEIPANNKGVRVSDMSSGLDDEEEDDDSEGSISLSESEEEEEGSEDEDDDSEDEENGSETGSESGSNASGDAETRTMKRMSTDLFSDGFSEAGSEGSEGEPKNSTESLSKHAKKLKILSKQIAELEAENVGKKDWTLKGEATSKDRPKNSLLEEDLEFEHIQKIAPAITEEKTLGLEALIKQRILDGQFDDVIRRRPIDLKAFLPSRLLELQDTKSSRSLAESYEDEYRSEKIRSETGMKPIDTKDETLAKSHEEIQEIYEDLFGKLDALSNAHFTPKAPKTMIKTINNLPTIALESALPTSMGSSTLLAPEELYSINPKDIQLDSNELTHSQKQTQRKERKAKRKDQLKKIELVTGKPVVTKEVKEVNQMSVKEQKESVLKDLSKVEGVKLIGKRSMGGEDGPTKKKFRKLQNGSGLKL